MIFGYLGKNSYGRKKNGARDGVRSRNPQNHNLMLYQLSYSRHQGVKTAHIVSYRRYNFNPLFEIYYERVLCHYKCEFSHLL